MLEILHITQTSDTFNVKCRQCNSVWNSWLIDSLVTSKKKKTSVILVTMLENLAWILIIVKNMKNITNLFNKNSCINSEARAILLLVSRLSTIKTQLWWDKLSTHMAWQKTAITSPTVFPWWFHTPHTFITMNICSTILSRNSIAKWYFNGIHTFSKAFLWFCICHWPWHPFTADKDLFFQNLSHSIQRN